LKKFGPNRIYLTFFPQKSPNVASSKARFCRQTSLEIMQRNIHHRSRLRVTVRRERRAFAIRL
jgi:hypothetical protein